MSRMLLSLVVSCVVFSIPAVYAGGQPTFSLEPLTPTTFLITKKDVRIVQYRVTNHTSMTRELTMRPIAGVTQETSGAGYCTNPFTLSPQQSCTLSLVLNGADLPRSIRNMPEICKTNGGGDNTPSSFLCSRPSYSNGLNITVFPTSSRVIIPLSVNPAILTLQTSASPVTLTVTSHATAASLGRNIIVELPASWSDVQQNAEDCKFLAPNQSCHIILTPGNTEHAEESVVVQGDNTQPAHVLMSVQAFTTVLSESISTLGLSVNNMSLNAALTGKPRKIIISNTGTREALDVVYSVEPNLPSGTSISPATCGNILSGDTCDLTITPGSTASSSESELMVSSSNTNPLISNINVLTYGDTYQSGYLFAVDDTTLDTESIAGQIAAFSDQAPAIPPGEVNPNGALWSANPQGSVDNTLLYGINS